MTSPPSAVPPPTGPFVTTEWLAAALGSPDLAVVDGSWYLPTQNREARAEYLAEHIPGAVFFDLDTIADTTSGLPHMLPDPAAFAAAMRLLGIDERMRIVVYDGAGLFSAARVRWTFRTFGAANVFLLEGGLPQWKAEGRPLEDGLVSRELRTFTARLDAAAVADVAAVRDAMRIGQFQLVDGRPAERFRGEAPEPRPGLRAGHIPGSFSLPFASLVEDGRLKSPSDLAAAFTEAGVALDRPVVTSCGSGVSAAILALALERLGRPARLYDGSWAEWGARADLPVATGPAEHAAAAEPTAAEPG